MIGLITRGLSTGWSGSKSTFILSGFGCYKMLAWLSLDILLIVKVSSRLDFEAIVFVVLESCEMRRTFFSFCFLLFSHTNKSTSSISKARPTAAMAIIRPRLLLLWATTEPPHEFDWMLHCSVSPPHTRPSASRHVEGPHRPFITMYPSIHLHIYMGTVWRSWTEHMAFWPHGLYCEASSQVIFDWRKTVKFCTSGWRVMFSCGTPVDVLVFHESFDRLKAVV